VEHLDLQGTREEAIIQILRSIPIATQKDVTRELVLNGYPVGGLKRMLLKYPFLGRVCNERGLIQQITLLEEEADRYLTKLRVPVVELDSVTLVDDSSSLAYARHIITGLDTIAVDCEGEDLGETGQLCLVQIGCENNQFLFDMLDSNPVKAEITLLLKEWFEDEKKIKVFHDCKQDSSALYHQYNIRLRGVLDTQVMYTYTGTNRKKSISFSKLCEKYGLEGNPYKRQVQPCFQLKRPYWRTRPLTPLMKMYAAHDVISLVPLSRTMLSEIDKSRVEEMNDAIDANVMHFEELVAKAKVPKEIPVVVTKTNPVIVSEFNPVVVPQSNPVITETVLIQQCTEPIVVDEIDQLLDLMPEEIRDYINGLPADFSVEEIVEIAMDVHRPYEVFYYRGKRMSFGKVTFEHINHVAEQLEFGGDNRSGIDGTLHRISSMKNRGGEINGLTLRVGRAVMNIADRLSDITDKTESILLLGHPGTGKTTIMRDIARVMSEKDRVMIVDTSCEIGGFGDTPHQAIGKARRMQVPDIRMQQEVMIQAVQNHTPDVIVIDEIGTSKEVFTARTIAQRGVVLCASAHGNMQSIMKNPILCNLLGGVETVIIGDAAALQHDNKKVHTQMKDTPIFENIIELSKEDLNSWKVYRDISSVVKKILAGKSYQYELRSFDPETSVMTKRIETVDPLAPQIQ